MNDTRQPQNTPPTAKRSRQPEIRPVKTSYGADIKPVYGPEDLAGFSPERELGSPGQFPYTPEDSIHPMPSQSRNALPVQKSPQIAAVALLLLNEQPERRLEIGIVSGEGRVQRATLQSCSIRAFSQLKLLQRSRDEAPLTRRQPWGARPILPIRTVRSRREDGSPVQCCHTEYFILQSL